MQIQPAVSVFQPGLKPAREIPDNDEGPLSPGGGIFMTDFNPLTGAILGSSQVQTGLEKQKQVRRMQNVRKNSATPQDTFEKQVESGEEVSGVHDQNDQEDSARQRKKRRQPPPDDSQQHHIDMTA